MLNGTDGAPEATHTADSPAKTSHDHTDATQTGAGARDTFLDAVKAIAIGRVIAWHTWTWWWLSWVGAMPAMFFASGALLDVSVQRHGYVTTLRSRTRRLLIPFWWYGACAVAVMVAVGWRPGVRELAPWVLPLGDPVGSDRTPGLWIPLWYLRAYLWFVIAAPVLRWTVTTFGRAALAAPVLATLAIWSLERGGTTVPLAVGDFAAYSFFVFVGMLYARGARPGLRTTALLAVGTFAAAVFWCVRYGPATSIVNSSYPLVLLAGTATLAVLFLLAPVLGDLRGRWGALVRVIGRRALTIYLWQGFGLVAADELIRRQDLPPVLAGVAAIVVVVTVTAAAAGAFGWIEDVAAHRTPRWPTVRTAPVALVAVVLLVAAAVVEPAAGTVPEMPASGRAVLTRDAFNERSGTPSESTDAAPLDGDLASRLDTAFEDWRQRNMSVLRELGSQRIEVAVVTGAGDEHTLEWISDGEPPDDGVVAWLSISKVVTGAWLAQLADDGVVRLDDPVSTYLDGIPHGDEITLAHLARHQGGLSAAADSSFENSHPRDDLQRFFDAPELLFTPGEGFHYTRVAYYLLAWALEEASGTAWTDVVRDWAAESSTTIVIDEDVNPLMASSHPGGGDYRGRLWSSGGLAATRTDSARFFRWLLTDGITPSARSLMASFDDRAFANLFGLGVLPLCPCTDDGDWQRAQRYGLDSAIGSWAFDEVSGSAVFMTADTWARTGPQAVFFDLTHDLLDAVGGGIRAPATGDDARSDAHTDAHTDGGTVGNP